MKPPLAAQSKAEKKMSVNRGKCVKSIAAIILVGATGTWSGSALAQFSRPDDAIKYRKSVMFVMQQNFARVLSMTAGKTPFDADVAIDSIEVANFMAKLSWVAFAEGTEKGDTKAKPEIWTEAARFREYADLTQAEMQKLAIEARVGSLESIRSSVRATAMSCKNCHDTFRKD